MKVSGFRFFGNRQMVRLLRNFEPDGNLPQIINRTFVEDAALVLFSRAHNDGFLNARLRADFILPDDSKSRLVWTNALDVQLPGDFAAREVHFRIQRGVRFYYQSLTIEGLEAMPESEAGDYFVSGDTMVRLRTSRIYNHGLLEDSLGSLREALVRQGYHDSIVTTQLVDINHPSGAVDVRVRVEEGLPTMVQSVAVTVDLPEDDQGTNHWTLHPNEPFSRLWQQKLAGQLRNQQYARGYPDTTVAFTVLHSETNATNIQIDLAAQVTPGPRIRLGETIFSGNKRTHTSVLEARVKLEEGEWLNRLEAEQSRQRLARLGVFDTVGLRYEDVEDHTRNVVFDLKENKPLSLSLLAGYGSYELLRGGVELEQRNVWGRAHDLRLLAVQSFKSTSGDFQYTVPEVLRENQSVFFKASGLHREEVTFTREEYGGSVGILRRLAPIQTDFGMHYDYEFLTADDLNLSTTNTLGVTDARSAAIVFELNRDRRETPLFPERGLKLSSRFEFAATPLGGNVDYQRVILGSSYHFDFGGGRLVHLGLLHALSFTFGGNSEDLPFNKRYFPGGQNSVRGYQDGEASPLDEDGNQLGAETYTQINVEFEQMLTKSWSVVTFFDGVGFAVERDGYPWDEELYSVGGGIRWHSPIGPVRLEYGYNLDPRPQDPSGTLHFSIGFPF